MQSFKISLMDILRRGGLRMTVRQSWTRIEEWLLENAPPIRKSLRPPAKEDALDKLQSKLGMSLPKDFAESLLIHDGQKTDADAGLFPYTEDVFGPGPSFRLLPLSEIAREWKMMKELHDLGEFEGHKTKPERGICRDWWNPGWVPIAENGGGDFFCLDLAPGRGGTVGQVIVFCHDMDERRRMAKSFAAWLAKLARGFAAGKYGLDEDEGIVEQ
jgi:cell wall assembly regulator SMI1